MLRNRSIVEKTSKNPQQYCYLSRILYNKKTTVNISKKDIIMCGKKVLQKNVQILYIS